MKPDYGFLVCVQPRDRLHWGNGERYNGSSFTVVPSFKPQLQELHGRGGRSRKPDILRFYNTSLVVLRKISKEGFGTSLQRRDARDVPHLHNKPFSWSCGTMNRARDRPGIAFIALVVLPAGDSREPAGARLGRAKLLRDCAIAPEVCSR